MSEDKSSIVRVFLHLLLLLVLFALMAYKAGYSRGWDARDSMDAVAQP